MDNKTYPLELLYDGECAICRFDVAHFRRRNTQGLLTFTDISAPGFEPAPYGKTRDQLLARMHARRADGSLAEGADVFRLACGATGLTGLKAVMEFPGLRSLTDLAYTLFARNRVWLSRRVGGIFARLTPICDGDSCSLPGVRS
jgi:predicted DCC family thiol-disulfide oxidoreductase YuxK